MDGCCGAWAYNDTTDELSCGICNCSTEYQGFDLVGDKASEMMLTSYEKFDKSNHNTFCSCMLYNIKPMVYVDTTMRPYYITVTS